MTAPDGPSVPTAGQVLQLFQQAWPNKPCYPSLEDCDRIAIMLHSIIKPMTPWPLPLPSVELADAGRYASLFLKHTPAVRRRLENKAGAFGQVAATLQAGAKIHAPGVEGDYDPLHEDRRRLAALMTALDTAQAAVAALMNIAKPTRPQIEWAQIIAEFARRAWKHTGLTVPLSVKVERDDASAELTMKPLVLFVHQALSLIQQTCNPATIAEALRGRRGRERQGRPKKSIFSPTYEPSSKLTKTRL